jgi:uncharacterized membrane protein YedE/YeeE
MMDMIQQPWPWYIAGPVIGLMVPLALLIANKRFGVSSSLRHICAACVPARIEFFQYNWKDELWSLFFVSGILIGGFLSDRFLVNYDQVAISSQTLTDLKALGITRYDGFMPEDIFSWENLLSFQGMFIIAFGGFLVGFGARWAGGCTSGHSISGLSHLKLLSLVATISFFIGGLFITHFIYPLIF